MERSLRHTALGAQWLILFSFYILLKHRTNYSAISYIKYTLLLVLAIGIHPYFLPMIAAFGLVNLIDDIKRKKYISIVLFAVALSFAYLAGCIIGVLGTGVQVSRWGYGYFSMNLNAIINPTSCGGYTWSTLLKTHPQILGNYDGFNYLGAGMLVGVIMVLVLTLAFDMQKNILIKIKDNWYLCIVMLLCFAFSVSNMVTFNDKTLLEIPLPAFIIDLCGIFRASSRIFYPVYYVIFIIVILGIWNYKAKLNRKTIYSLLMLILTIQLFDIHLCIYEKHSRMDKKIFHFNFR